MTEIIKLQDRTIIEIYGIDCKKFLQGLITNDIDKVENSRLIYSAMLNPKGRFLYDFFIFKNDEKFFLDCLASRNEELIKKLNFYKLKSQVFIKRNDEISVFVDLEKNFYDAEFIFCDPRNDKMGNRIYSTKETAAQNEDTKYHLQRISLKIPESEYDLTYDKSIINEFGFDEINAIDYKKGCYVGQELIARTHNLGQVRKKIFYVKIDGTEKIEKNCEITCEGKNVGLLLSSVIYDKKLHALALIKDEVFAQDSSPNLFCGNKNLII